MDKISSHFFSILNIFSEHLNLHLTQGDNIKIISQWKTILEVGKNKFATIDPNIPKALLDHKSKLSDAFTDLKLLSDFLVVLKRKKVSVFFDHIGFCYLVDSKKAEKNRLKKVAQEEHLSIYESPSNDASLWLFMGDKKNMHTPLIEFLPTEKVSDYYQDYWLPHIHIDLHTHLTIDEIKYSTHTIFHGIKTANPTVVMNGIIYQARIWLGVVSGVNLCLDLGTNKINSFYQRRHLLERI